MIKLPNETPWQVAIYAYVANRSQGLVETKIKSLGGRGVNEVFEVKFKLPSNPKWLPLCVAGIDTIYEGRYSSAGTLLGKTAVGRMKDDEFDPYTRPIPVNS